MHHLQQYFMFHRKPIRTKLVKTITKRLSTLIMRSMLLACVWVAGTSHAQSVSSVIAMNTDPTLARTLLNAFEEMGESYKPRTEHFLDDGQPKYINRLIQEESPYLLQHAHNPVNWYPWGEEAFKTAKLQNKPVFLSIGYATCHWCHVMERESFENELIAELMNKDFISIKVDREQLPDVDSLYMSAIMLINGNGGWPMSSFLDTDGRAFHGGTYFRPEEFAKLLDLISTVWEQNHTAVLEQATQVSEAIKQANDLTATAEEVGSMEINVAFAAALSRFDDFQGGFSQAPKFPQESLLHFLLDYAERNDNAKALQAAHFSLQRMAAGGIHDQIGGGFHRYSVDDEWLLPHFEKMLYNQGSLARNYTQAFYLTGDQDHARTARRILDYVLRDMRADNGLFYSATDADSDGGEGRFFTWTPAELVDVLGKEDAKLAENLWGVTESGHLEERSILHLPESLEELSNSLHTDANALHKERDRLADILFAHRQGRIAPLRDEKVITAWNGLMITAYAEAYDTLGNQRYLLASVDAAEALWKSARPAPDTLWRTQFEGQLSVDARQSDYAYFAEALLSLYDITGHMQWLERAEELTKAMLDLFWDNDKGGFFMSSENKSDVTLVIRPKDLYDTSMPSGNSVALRVMSQLFKRTGKKLYSEYIDRLISYFSSSLKRPTGGHFYLLTGVSDYLQGETGPRKFGARGVLKATAAKTPDGSITVQIDIADGWHINSNQPYQDYLIPTTLRANDGTLKNLIYPVAIERKLGFESTVLSLYEGTVVLKAQAVGSNVHQLQTRLQACSDKVCLPPENLVLSLSR